MSADNGIYVLTTQDKFKKVGTHKFENFFLKNGRTITAYRVAHAQAIDNFEWYKENEIHNLGKWMNDIFGKSEIFYNYDDAMDRAYIIAQDYDILEYGIQDLDATEFNFPGC